MKERRSTSIIRPNNDNVNETSLKKLKDNSSNSKKISFSDNLQKSLRTGVESILIDIEEAVSFLNSKNDNKIGNKDNKKLPKPLDVGIKPLDLNKFKLGKKIGKGSFSYVYTVKQIDTGKIFAAKITKNKIHEGNKDSHEGINFLREVRILSELSHPFVLKFIGFSPTDFNGGFHPVIITEYHPNNSLEHVLQMEREKKIDIPGLNLNKTILVYKIAKAMSYIHSRNIVHRDLSVNNIFLSKNLNPIIADFGFAKKVNEPNVPEIVGTPSFIAPETYFNYEYNRPIDVYAFAMIMYELCVNEYPFKGLNAYEIMYKLSSNENRPPIPKETPERIKKLITDCWNDDPSKRPTFEQIVNDFQNDSSFFNDEKEAKFFKENIENCRLPEYDFRPIYKKYLNEYESESSTTDDYDIECSSILSY